MNKRLIGVAFIAVLVCLVGCQSNRSVTPIAAGVNLESEDQSAAPTINLESGKLEVGPAQKVRADEHISNPSPRTQLSALVLGPGVYNVAAHVAILAELEKLEPRPRIVTGMGMGAWIAALYAFGQTPQLIEWKLFKFYSEAAELRPFSNEWKKLLAQKLLADLPNAQIDQAKMVLLLPVYDLRERKVRYLKRGNLADALMAAVTIASESKSGQSTSIEWKYFSRSDLDQVSPDFIIGIDVLDEDVRFERPDDYLMGIFGRLIGWRSQLDGEFDYFAKLPWKGQLDSTKRLSFNMLAARKQIEGQRMDIQQTMNSIDEKDIYKE